MAQTLLPFLLLASAFQAYATPHFPQLVVRGGLSDALATPTPTIRPKLRVRQFNNGTVSSSSQDPEESPDPTPDTTTVIPPFTPPTTTISGAAETTAAKQIGPVIWALWNKRNLLEDDNTKQQYIDLVDQTKDDVTNLFNNLDTKPDPPSQCCSTSLKKRSLISGIGDLLKTAADIVSCAECVVNNLDNIVKTVPPDIDIVDTLTDTLNDLKTKLDDLDDSDDQNSQSESQSQSDSSSSQSSSCSSSTVTDCTLDIYESTTFFVTDGSTTSAVATSTSTSCQTVTACSATPTTEYTTIATSTTSSTSSDDDICGPRACNGAACVAKRAMQTQAPLPSTYPYPELNPENFFPYLNTTMDETHLFGKRDVRGPGTGDWSDFYNGLKGDSATTLMDINNGVMGTETAVEFVSFNTAQQNIVIEGLYGCTSVIIVDHRGAFANHIWQESALNDVPAGTWQKDGIDLLSNYLDTYAGNTFTSNAKAFIMASSNSPVDNTGGVDNEVYPPTIIDGYPTETELAALSNSAPPPKYSDKTDELASLIQQKIPGIAQPTVWTYKRQKVQAIRDLGSGFGRAAVMYDPAQSVDPTGGSNQPANTGAWQVYIQAASVGQDLWPNLELQIWRVNVDAQGNKQSANVLHIGNVGYVVDPCAGDLEPPVPDSMSLNPGNPIIDIGLHATDDDDSTPQKFRIQDANGNDWHTDCVFQGNGVYAPTADEGLIAGDLKCDDGFTVQCLRPFNNQATTCGGQPISDCDQGQLGSTCFDYYQLLATCRV